MIMIKNIVLLYVVLSDTKVLVLLCIDAIKEDHGVDIKILTTEIIFFVFF